MSSSRARFSSSCRRSCKRSRIARSAADGLGLGVALTGITLPLGDGGGSFGSLADPSLPAVCFSPDCLSPAGLSAASLLAVPPWPLAFSLFSPLGSGTEPVVTSALSLSTASGGMTGRNDRSSRSRGRAFGSGKLNICWAQERLLSVGRTAPGAAWITVTSLNLDESPSDSDAKRPSSRSAATSASRQVLATTAIGIRRRSRKYSIMLLSHAP